MEETLKAEISRLWGLIEGASRVAIVSHVHPDGDAVGSTCALAAYLASLGIRADVLYPTPVPHAVEFLCEGLSVHVWSENAGACRIALAGADLLVCLDLNAFGRTEAMADDLRNLDVPKVLIDHHLGPDRDSFDLCFSETEISSASELLFNILLELPGADGNPSNLPARTNVALMTGMTTDTNNFANSVYPSTFRMASMLLAAGVDRDDILSRLFNNYGENRLRLFGTMLKDDMEITPEGVSVMFLTKRLKKKYNIGEGDIEGLVNQPLAIGHVCMSILAKEEDEGPVRMSVRSKRGVSANMLCREFFHGGGHEQAAGGKILVPEDVASVELVRQYVLECADKFMERYDS